MAVRALTLVLVLLLAAPAHAADFIVHVPDDLIEECCLWHHFYNSNKNPTQHEKSQFFLEKGIFDPATNWVLDTLVMVKTFGKKRGWGHTGITVEVKDTSD